MNREQIIRDTAYAIWEAEGKPRGREEEHWKIAEKQVANSADTATNGASPASRAKNVKQETAAAPKKAARKVAK